MIDDLVMWLRAQLDEDERAARFAAEIAARSFPADEFDVSRWDWAPLHRHRVSGGSGVGHLAGAPSPGFVLADVAAKRRILEDYVGAFWAARNREGEPRAVALRDGRMLAYEGAVRLLALPYADRDGYRAEEWKP